MNIHFPFNKNESFLPWIGEQQNIEHFRVNCYFVIFRFTKFNSVTWVVVLSYLGSPIQLLTLKSLYFSSVFCKVSLQCPGFSELFSLHISISILSVHFFTVRCHIFSHVPTPLYALLIFKNCKRCHKILKCDFFLA